MDIHIVVLPRSSRKEVVGMLSDGTLKVKLTAPPVDGEANKQLIELLAEYYDVPKSCVTLVKGEKSKKKLVRIDY